MASYRYLVDTANAMKNIDATVIANILSIPIELARDIINGKTVKIEDCPYPIVSVFGTACLEVPTLSKWPDAGTVHIPIMKLPYERGWVSYSEFHQMILFWQACETLSNFPRPKETQ